MKVIKQILLGAVLVLFLFVSYLLSENVYRFFAIKLNQNILKSFHGINERIAVSEIENMIRFYHQLILNSTTL